MKNDLLLHKWVEGTITAEELEIFKLRPEYESLTEIYRHTEGMTVASIDEKAMLENILKQPKQEQIKSKEAIVRDMPQPEKGRRVFLSSLVKYGAAASLLLLAGWFFLLKDDGGSGLVQYDIAKAQRVEGTLPDGSTFVLNAESHLSYDAKTWDKNRNIDLTGEAFFKVKKGSKFLVTTPNGKVQVLGTQFNVRSRAQCLEVSCTSGKVAVLATTGKVLGELLPSDVIRVTKDVVDDKWKLQNTNSSWVSGMTSLKNVPVSIVIKELERQFDIKIESNTINTQEKISVNFQNKNLDLALKTALGQLGVTYKINGKKVSLQK